MWALVDFIQDTREPLVLASINVAFHAGAHFVCGTLAPIGPTTRPDCRTNTSKSLPSAVTRNFDTLASLAALCNVTTLIFITGAHVALLATRLASMSDYITNVYTCKPIATCERSIRLPIATAAIRVGASQVFARQGLRVFQLGAA